MEDTPTLAGKPILGLLLVEWAGTALMTWLDCALNPADFHLFKAQHFRTALGVAYIVRFSVEQCTATLPIAATSAAAGVRDADKAWIFVLHPGFPAYAVMTSMVHRDFP